MTVLFNILVNIPWYDFQLREWGMYPGHVGSGHLDYTIGTNSEYAYNQMQWAYRKQFLMYFVFPLILFSVEGTGSMTMPVVKFLIGDQNPIERV